MLKNKNNKEIKIIKVIKTEKVKKKSITIDCIFFYFLSSKRMFNSRNNFIIFLIISSFN